MELPVQCECENCKKNRLHLQLGLNKEHKCFHSICEGDYIKVFSNGNYIETGTFLRIENRIIIWLDKHGNMNLTEISGINVQKISNTPISKEENNSDITF